MTTNERPFVNAFYDPTTSTLNYGHAEDSTVLWHERAHLEMPPISVPPVESLFAKIYDMQRLEFRAYAGNLFRSEHPRLVEVIEARAGKKLDDIELGLVLRENREEPLPGRCDECDYEVLPYEMPAIVARLEVIFAKELASGERS